MSFYTSLSGLRAAQTDLSVTANNVANVGTQGFKKSRAEFGDIISASPLQSSNIIGQGTRLKSIQQQFTQGGFQTTDRALDLAISGDGFFVTRSDVTGGQVAFTRNGSFSVDGNRYVTDADGNYLQVLPVDDSGAVTATGLSATKNLQIPLTAGDARANENVDLAVALPATADIPSERSVYSDTNPYAFDRLDANSYNYSSATTVYDTAGNAIPATIYYTRTSAPTDADGSSSWEARLFVGNSEVNPTGTTGPLTLTFDANGTLTAPTDAVSYENVQPAGATAPIGLTFDYGTATKQAASPFTLASFTQDGYPAGELNNVSVGSDGLVTATFSNGTTQKLGKVVMATFANPAGLRQLGSTNWGVTSASGEPIIGEPGSGGFGTLQAGAVEQSNVDITDELVAMIAAQRNFSANAKAIEAANQLTDTITNLRT